MIVKSHAFKYDIMRQAYEKRYGNIIKKDNIQCVVWKESHINTNLIFNSSNPQPNSLISLANKNDKLKFLIPIRNPMDCAVSCVNGYLHYFPNCNTKEMFLEALMKLYRVLLDVQDIIPQQVFIFRQQDMNIRTVKLLQGFLNVPLDTRYSEDVQNVWNLKPSYQHNKKFKDLLCKLIDKYELKQFEDFLE